MRITKNGENVAIQFRVNGISGTKDDETKNYIHCVTRLAREMLPFSVARMGFISEDDCIMAVIISRETYDLLDELKFFSKYR